MTATSDIRWRPWSPSAFEEARRGDKPILLRLSAVWCHWCHVMDDTSDRHPDAVRLLNEKYVPVRVDIDQFPDVRERYNFGGFPTSAFLTPEGDIITGGTYIPPADFVRLLEEVEAAYRTQKPQILSRAREMAEHEARHEREATGAAAADAAAASKAAAKIVDEVAQSLLVQFDPENGGFGSAPKFPHPAAVELTLSLHRLGHGKEYSALVRRTLERMREAELWDAEEKAFFRYATRADWSEPHYEKMLEGNAGLLSNYALAGAAFDRPEWLRVASDQRAYLDRVLRDPETKLFYGSQDADEDYYALPLAQRATRNPPFVDRTFYTDWNALMILAFLDAFRSTGDPRYRDEALHALGSLCDRNWRDGSAFLHFSKPGAEPQRPGLFTDQVQGALALLRAHELTGEGRWLALARKAVDGALATMWDAGRSRFLDRAMTGDELGRVRRRQHNVVENGVAVRVLLRLAHFAESPAYSDRAKALLASYADEADRWGIFASELALGALESRATPAVVHIVAEPTEAAGFLREIFRIRHPLVLVRCLRPSEGKAVASKLGLALPRAPSLFACAGKACTRAYKPGEAFADDVTRLARWTR